MYFLWEQGSCCLFEKNAWIRHEKRRKGGGRKPAGKCGISTRQKNGGTRVKLGKTRLKSFVITSEGEVKGVEMGQGGRAGEVSNCE